MISKESSMQLFWPAANNSRRGDPQEGELKKLALIFRSKTDLEGRINL